MPLQLSGLPPVPSLSAFAYCMIGAAFWLRAAGGLLAGGKSHPVSTSSAWRKRRSVDALGLSSVSFGVTSSLQVLDFCNSKTASSLSAAWRRKLGAANEDDRCGELSLLEFWLSWCILESIFSRVSTPSPEESPAVILAVLADAVAEVTGSARRGIAMEHALVTGTSWSGSGIGSGTANCSALSPNWLDL